MRPALLIIALVTFATAASAAAPVNPRYVDFEEVAGGTVEGKAIIEKYVKKRGEWEKDMKARAKAITDEAARFNADESKHTKEQVEGFVADYEAKKRNFREEVDRTQKELIDALKAELAPIEEKVRKFAKTYAEQQGIQILDERVVAWTRPGYDYTAELIRAYDAASAK